METLKKCVLTSWRTPVLPENFEFITRIGQEYRIKHWGVLTTTSQRIGLSGMVSFTWQCDQPFSLPRFMLSSGTLFGNVSVNIASIRIRGQSYRLFILTCLVTTQFLRFETLFKVVRSKSHIGYINVSVQILSAKKLPLAPLLMRIFFFPAARWWENS